MSQKDAIKILADAIDELAKAVNMSTRGAENRPIRIAADKASALAEEARNTSG